MDTHFDVEIRDIEYAIIDGAPLLARLYLPQGAGPFRAVVEVHGGAWSSNDRLTNEVIHNRLAASGVVVMALDFRMPPAAQYPASIQDINYAVRWLKSAAPQFGSSADNVGLLGTSSGGHQAMLCALRPLEPAFCGSAHQPTNDAPAPAANIDATVRFVVLCWPVVDPVARYQMVQDKANERLVNAHHAYWPSVDAMAKGSPQRIVEGDEAFLKPPVLLIQGTGDNNLTPDMADNFTSAYTRAGGSIELEKFDNAPHAFIAADPSSPAAERALELIERFVHSERRS